MLLGVIYDGHVLNGFECISPKNCYNMNTKKMGVLKQSINEHLQLWNSGAAELLYI